MNAKRKVPEENRETNSNLKENYFFAKNEGIPQCVECLQVISVSKVSNVYQYCHTKHKEKKGNGTVASRKAILN